MTKPDFTGIRKQKDYSAWHRTLPNNCYMVDLDSVEWRAEKGIVAFIEVAQSNDVYSPFEIAERKWFQAKILHELQKVTKIPAYFTIHDPELTKFYIFKINTKKPVFWKVMSNSEYSEFIKSLGEEEKS